eukprot:2605323-Rhodomonas_salina.1
MQAYQIFESDDEIDTASVKQIIGSFEIHTSDVFSSPMAFHPAEPRRHYEVTGRLRFTKRSRRPHFHPLVEPVQVWLVDVP